LEKRSRQNLRRVRIGKKKSRRQEIQKLRTYIEKKTNVHERVGWEMGEKKDISRHMVTHGKGARKGRKDGGYREKQKVLKTKKKIA